MSYKRISLRFNMEDADERRAWELLHNGDIAVINTEIIKRINDAERYKHLEWILRKVVTILNGQRRYYSPLRSSFLEQAASGIYPDELPYLPKLSSNAVTKQIVPLTNENIRLACDCCGFPTDTSCAEKERFLRSCGQEIYGFLHTDERGNLLGGAEYLPSMLVPYDIPHSEDAAFITCVYLSDAEYDYKSAPIKALEQYLRKTYARVFAVTDEKGVFAGHSH